MDAAMINAGEVQPKTKVSIITRMIALVAFTIPLLGGAMSSFFLFVAFRALQGNQSAGVGVVMAALKEASLPVIVSLYLAAFFAFVVIVVLVVRMFVQTKTASPPFWYFILSGILCLVSAGFFWKAKLLFLDVLSPGSSTAANGIAGIAAEINLMLWLSIIGAPVVFVILLVLSVLPLSSRAGAKWGSLAAASVVWILLVATAVAIPYLIDGPKRKNEMVALPVSTNSSYSDHDADVEKDASLVLTLTADNKLYYRQVRDVNGKVERTETVVTIDELPAKIKTAMEGKTPDKRIAYFKCDINAAYENILPIFRAIRNADVDKVGLVVVGKKDADDPYQTRPVSFPVRLGDEVRRTITNDLPAGLSDEPPPPPGLKNANSSRRVEPRKEQLTNLSLKPNPLTLVAAVDKDGKLLLNNEPKGTMPDASRIETTLKNIFKDREENGVLREGTNEVEKKTYIKASKSTKYGDLIKLFEAVRTSGASPIGIQIDDVN